MAEKQSVERYRAIVENRTEMICCFLQDGTITFVNEAYCRYFKKHRDELIGQKFSPLIPESDQEKVFEKINSVNPTAPIVTHEHRVVSPSGKICWHKWTNRAIFNDQNKLLEYQAVGWDITERKRAEKALRESEEKFRTVAEQSPNMIFIHKKGKIVFQNDRCVDMMGYQSDEFYAPDFNFRTLLAPKSLELAESSFKKHMKGLEVEPLEYTLLRKDGSRINTIINTKLINYEGEKAVLGVVTDITDRKQSEKALRESENRFRTLVETMTDGLGIQDKNGLISYVNNKFCQMLNYRPHDFIGRPVADFLDDKNKKRLKEQLSVRKRGKVKPYELVWERKDGTKVHTMMSPQAVFDDKNQFSGSFAVITDISELKRTEKKLQKARDELEQRVEARTKELEIKNRSLEDLNIAMKVLLEKRAEDNVKLEDNVFTNVRELITPMFRKIKKTKLDDHQKMMLNIIESNLNEITSPFTRKLSMKHLNLTPTELKIANYIKHGTTTKMIAELMKSSPRTIETHRKNIRKKIGLNQKSKNLRSYLISLH